MTENIDDGEAAVLIVQLDDGWHIQIAFGDGSAYHSPEAFRTKTEAKAAFRKFWAENFSGPDTFQ